MFKALLKKQFLELKALYFTNKKGGKSRSKSGAVGLMILFGFLFLCIAVAIYGMASLFAESFFAAGMQWLYFALLGLMAIALGTLGSVFSTYATLYHAKDNEFLLSLPIRPSMILVVRMVSVYATSFLYSGVVWIPAVIKYFFSGNPSTLAIIFTLLLSFIIPLFVTVLSCVLGWVVALIAGRLKNKSFITVILTVALLGGYYYFYFNINKYLQMLVMNGDKVGGAIKTWIYPIYQLGLGATGEVLPMIIFTAITGVLFALCMLVLSRSFIRIVTTNKGAGKQIYKEQKAKASSAGSALLRKELRRFTASPTYMLNGGLGLVIMPALAVIAIIKRAALNDAIGMFSEMMPKIAGCVPVIAVATVALAASMNAITAPSISLEGKTLWIVRSLPLDTREVLHAKERLHMLLNIIPCVVSTALIGWVVGADVFTIISMIALVSAFVWTSAVCGLALNLKKPLLDWTNEAVPIKQSFSVMIALFGGWILAIGIAAGGYACAVLIPAWAYMLLCSAVLAAVSLLIKRWLDTKGVEIFENL